MCQLLGSNLYDFSLVGSSWVIFPRDLRTGLSSKREILLNVNLQISFSVADLDYRVDLFEFRGKSESIDEEHVMSTIHQ